MPNPSSEDLLQALDSSRLVADDSLQKVADSSRARPDSDPGELLEPLVTGGELTRWQAEQLLAGGTRFDLGNYRLLEWLGRGGMGIVFRARHTVMDRVVALKVIRKSVLPSPDAVSRFEREIRTIAALEHPNIVRALDADRAEDLLLLVMEYIDGDDLDHLVRRRGKIPPGLACEMIRQAALGLGHAHERGLVHRDLKPSNLLVRGHDVRGHGGSDTIEVKILDFGLARFIQESPEAGSITQPGAVIGTPDFMSPEQLRSTRLADIRSDIYSLGATLFFLLTGDFLFPAEGMAEKLAAKMLRDSPALESKGLADCTAIQTVLSRMLARDPHDRYATPGEVAAALEPLSEFDAEKARVLVRPRRRVEGVQGADAEGDGVGEEREGSSALTPAPELDEVLRWLRGPVHVNDSASTSTSANDPTPLAATHAEPAQAHALEPGARWRNRTKRVPVVAASIGAIALLALLVAIGPIQRWWSGDEHGTVQTPGGDSNAVAASFQTRVFRSGALMRAIDLLPLHEGDQVEFVGTIPKDHHAALFWIDGSGDLWDFDVEVAPSEVGQRFVHPGRNETRELDDEVGTETIFICANRSGKPTRDEVLAAIGKPSPVSELPKNTLLRFTQDETIVDQNRGAGTTRPKREFTAEAEVDALRTKLAAYFDVVAGVAVPHR